MKIVILTHTFPKTKNDVTAAFMKALADGMNEVGNDVFVLTPFDRDLKTRGYKFDVKQYKYIWPEGFHKMGYSRAMEGDMKLKWYNYVLIPFMIFFGIIALIKLIKKHDIDVVSVHWVLPNGIIAMFAGLVTGVPYYVALPGTDVHVAGKNVLFASAARLVALQSKGVYSNSSWLLKKFFRLGISHKNSGVIEYPINVGDFKPVKKGVEDYRRKLGIEKDERVILAVGRLVYKKGFDYLIKAMPEIIKKYPKVRLVIGGDGDQREEWENLARKLKIEGKVLFTGNIKRDEILYLYNLAEVNVAPSVVDRLGNVDGGPVVVFESMACGKPQVVTNVLGAADHIKDGVNGFVVAQRNSSELSKAIIKLLMNPNLSRKMGERNRKMVISEFTTKEIGKKYTKVFREGAAEA